MTPRLRKLALAIHLTMSVGWVGAVLVYLALGLAAATGSDVATRRGAWVAMELAGWYVLAPLACGTLLTGLVMALGTRWGLFRFYWVVVTLTLTTFAVVVLLQHLPAISAGAAAARTADAAGLDALGGDLFHASLGLVVLLANLVLNVYKPPGLTRYGWRRVNSARPPAPRAG